MPRPERSSRTEKATLWRAVRTNDYGLAVLNPDPEEITLRWLHQVGEVPIGQGDTAGLDASAVVGVRVPINSAIWRGALADWYGTGSGQDDTELMQVNSYSETPDAKGRVAYREIGMKRYRGNKPIFGG